MAKKKTIKVAEEATQQVDLTNLIDAAKSSLSQFDDAVDLTVNNDSEASPSDSLPAEAIAEPFIPEDEESANGGVMTTVGEINEVDSTNAVGAVENRLTDDGDALASTEIAKVEDEEQPWGLGAESAEVLDEEAVVEVKKSLEDWDQESPFAPLNDSTVDNLIDSQDVSAELQGTELEGFDSAAIEDLEFVEDTQLTSIIESVLFATDRPVSLPTLKQIFKGTNVTNARLKRAIDGLQVDYAGGHRGVTLEEVGSGYQLRTKIDNMEFLRRSFKAKAFKLSGPALEVLAIVAYKQPVVKAEIDEIRGVESGHLLRALMEKNLVLFAGKSDLPGKPMQYGTARKFLEVFGLRNLKELPTLSQIDELLPEGIGDEEQKPKLADITEGLSEKVGQSYSEGEEELTKITDQLEKIDTSSEFFEKEKLRQKEERDAEKARNLREAIAVGEKVATRDMNWLKRYDEQQAQSQGVPAPLDANPNDENQTESIEADLDQLTQDQAAAVSAGAVAGYIDESAELEAALEAWDADAILDEERLEANDLADIDEEVL